MIDLNREMGTRESGGATTHSGEPSYAYSFDRETWRGNYTTRHRAADAGKRALEQWDRPVEAVYVGRRIIARPHTAGHAADVIALMRESALAHGDEPVDADGIGTDAMKDLETRLSDLLESWLDRHDLRRNERIEAVSEHPVPLATAVSGGSDLDEEVHILGPEM